MSLQTLSRRIRFLTRGLVSTLILKIFHHAGFDFSKSIIIFGSTRSGSTWLAEIVSSAEGNIQIFEPMYDQYVGAAKSLGINQHLFLTADDAWPEGKDYFRQILSGRLLNPWLCSQIPPGRAFKAKRLVIKIVRGNLIIDWLLSQFELTQPVLIIRHPCAIVASQLEKGWTPSKKRLLGNRFFDEYPEFKSPCEKLDKPEQYAALAWCMRYFAPLALPKPYPYILVTYESLVRNGEQELTRLFAAWDLELTAAIKSKLLVPSSTITESSKVNLESDPLAGWTSKLTANQVDNILLVLEIFGLNFYNTNLEPDYERLENFCYSLKG